MKRLLALVAGGLGLRALLKRRSRTVSPPSPVDDQRAADLRAKLAQTKVQETDPAAPPETVDDRRADVHAKARQAIDDLGSP